MTTNGGSKRKLDEIKMLLWQVVGCVGSQFMKHWRMYECVLCCACTALLEFNVFAFGSTSFVPTPNAWYSRDLDFHTDTKQTYLFEMNEKCLEVPLWSSATRVCLRQSSNHIGSMNFLRINSFAPDWVKYLIELIILVCWMCVVDTSHTKWRTDLVFTFFFSSQLCTHFSYRTER